MQETKKFTINDTIVIKKNGVQKSVKINFEKNVAKEAEIQQILKKDGCIDIFKDLLFDKQ
jgi:hypothetical protein